MIKNTVNQSRKVCEHHYPIVPHGLSAGICTNCCQFLDPHDFPDREWAVLMLKAREEEKYLQEKSEQAKQRVRQQQERRKASRILLRRALLVISLLIGFSLLIQAASKAQTIQHDFGEVPPGSKLEHCFTLPAGDSPLSDISSGCDCLEGSKITNDSTICIELDISGYTGKTSKTTTVYRKDGSVTMIELLVTIKEDAPPPTKEETTTVTISSPPPEKTPPKETTTSSGTVKTKGKSNNNIFQKIGRGVSNLFKRRRPKRRKKWIFSFRRFPCPTKRWNLWGRNPYSSF